VRPSPFLTVRVGRTDAESDRVYPRRPVADIVVSVLRDGSRAVLGNFPMGEPVEGVVAELLLYSREVIVPLTQITVGFVVVF
jgi:hypothetical protein